ncbi:5141_t:CDS:2 [Ambispora gerdemannii]|uniref:5141_t:CDS:1 n=1 Tax=Ambispora gerdemannii TaxID=144530 RepID=A0A9N9AAK0_9GLOM|nr:5141_t:CDS:2 [Ambispora gerdemannii]
MTVLVKNTQRFLPIPKTLKRDLEKLLTLARFPDWDLGVHLAGNRYIRHLNNRYRNKAKPTDILSFPFTTVFSVFFFNALSPGILPHPETPDFRNLGDLVISVEYVKHWCKKHDQKFQKRLPVLCVHGICHLLGYDHETDVEWEEMKLREEEILDRFWAWKYN